MSLFVWQDFALLVMLCAWMPLGAPLKEPYKLLDFFSGRGRIAELASKAGVACAATDMSVDKDQLGQRCRQKAGRSFRSVMDWNGDAGFASFGCTLHGVFVPAKVGCASMPPRGLWRDPHVLWDGVLDLGDRQLRYIDAVGVHAHGQSAVGCEQKSQQDGH